MKSIKFLLSASLLLTATSTFAADLDGEKLYSTKGCTSCHGVAGNEPIMDSYPKLAGQSAAYLVAKLKSYKAGEISGGQSALMTPMASMLNEDEMGAVADYLSGAVECKPAEAE